MRPLMVKHVGSVSSDDRTFLIDGAASRLFLSKGAKALLRFYSKQATGFMPSRKHISKEIGISESQVDWVRRKLAEHGCIAVDDKCIVVDWNRIRIFASLDKALCSRHAKIAAVDSGPEAGNPHVFRKEDEFLPTQDLVTLFASMSEQEYKKWKKEYKQSKQTEVYKKIGT